MKFNKNSGSSKDVSEAVQTLVGAKTSFEGKVTGEDSICIDGGFKGTVEISGNLYINNRAKVEAEIKAKNIFIHGTVIGNVTALEHLNVGAKGRIIGDVQTKTLTVATGGILDGNCRMEKGLDKVQSGQSEKKDKKFGLLSRSEDAGKVVSGTGSRVQK